jgi:hypothetical protein
MRAHPVDISPTGCGRVGMAPGSRVEAHRLDASDGLQVGYGDAVHSSPHPNRRARMPFSPEDQRSHVPGCPHADLDAHFPMER